MKVTVCFGSVRVLVPCGAGDLLVRDLVREATLRYKKAIGQGPETWVGVRALRASSGGILDPDDRVRDVADDRETLTAECTAQTNRAAPADGASGSSAGTASPDMFRGGGGVGGSMRVPNTDSCVEVEVADLEEGVNGLQVRRGSEPVLHQDSLPPQRQMSEQTKRWSAAVVCRDDEARVTQKVSPLPLPEPPANTGHFQRQSNRLSMQFSGPGSGVWLDAAERIQTYGSKSLPRDARREPLGQDTPVLNSQQNHRVEDMLRWVSGVNNEASAHTVQERPLDLLPEVGNSERAISGLEVPVSPSSVAKSAAGGGGGAGGSTQTVAVALVKGEKGLGFTITTRDNPTGGHCPIYIKNILPKGAAVSDGRLRAGDRLVSVNGVSVSGLTQQQVVTLLRSTPTHTTVHIQVDRPNTNTATHRTHQKVEPQQSQSKFTEKSIGPPSSVSTKPTEAKTENRVSSIVNAINQNNVTSSMRGRIPKSSSKDDLLKKDQSTDNVIQDALNSSTNSVLGLRNRLILRLDVPVHDSEKAGLGISVKGKVTVGADPQDLGIFIKSVLHGGAASRDGRLHTNDQLLSVNGVSLVGQSNAEAMETLRRALLHSRPHVHGSISLTIARRNDSMDSLARWKDDTPPNGNDTTNSNENSNNNFNTVIYNSSSDKENKPVNNSIKSSESERGIDNHDGRSAKKHSSIVTINNNNSWVSNQSDDSKGYLERDKEVVPHDPKRDSFEWSRLDGWNPVIDRLTGLRNESYYMATQAEPAVNGHGHHYRQNHGHVHMSRSPPAHHNVIIEEDYGTTRGSGSDAVVESGSECGGVGGGGGAGGGGAGFSRDAVGRRSMSEKRHAAMDAKQTGTYRKIKENKAIHALRVGPSLGMRKSSSLESLQTAIQENQRHPRNEPIYARAHPHYYAEQLSFAAQLRASGKRDAATLIQEVSTTSPRRATEYEHIIALKHWLTDDHHGPDGMVRGSPQQSSLSTKKPSILKSLSTMFRIGKPNKKPEGAQEIYGRAHPVRASEKSLSREALERHNRSEDRDEPNPPTQRLEAAHSRQSSGERSSRQSSRRGERERDRDRDREREHPAPPYRSPPARTAPAPIHPPIQMDSAWGPAGHYVNYEEIQHNLNTRREKLSEVQIGQMRRQVHAQRAKAEEESRRAEAGYHSQRSCRAGGARPQSNYYEYDTAPPRRPGKLSHYH